MNFAETRLRNQQLVRQTFSRPEEVVSFMGAVQAQEYRLMRWAVAMRTRKPSIKAFSDAFNRGDIVRLHLLRGTWQLIAREDYGWMMDLYSKRAQKTIDGWMAANRIAISEDEYARVADVLERTAGELHSATKEDFALAVKAEFGEMDDHRLSYHIRHAELSGLLCNGDLLPMKPSYSLVAEKLGDYRKNFGRDEALALLAKKYFQSRSPATLEDFVWWSGLNTGDCKKAMASLGTALQSARRPGDSREFFILDSCDIASRSSRSVLLLPSYDEYLIGYKSRDIVLKPEHSPHAHNNSGNFSPVVVVDGLILGNWHPFKLSAEASFFTPEAERDLSSAWKQYFLGVNH